MCLLWCQRFADNCHVSCTSGRDISNIWPFCFCVSHSSVNTLPDQRLISISLFRILQWTHFFQYVVYFLCCASRTPVPVVTLFTPYSVLRHMLVWDPVEGSAGVMRWSHYCHFGEDVLWIWKSCLTKWKLVISEWKTHHRFSR